jgi:hypothetical protein
MRGRHSGRTDSVQHILGNENESPDEILVAALYDVCRFVGSFSKTEAAISIREWVRTIMKSASRYGLTEIDADTVKSLLAAATKEGSDSGFKAGLNDCATSHPAIEEKGRASAYREGVTDGMKRRDIATARMIRETELERLKREKFVPLVLAINLRNQITRHERHLIRLCPYCAHAITLEVCIPILGKLSDAERTNLEKLRKKKRVQTGEWDDPDPYSGSFPWFLADKVETFSQDSA